MFLKFVVTLTPHKPYKIVKITSLDDWHSDGFKKLTGHALELVEAEDEIDAYKKITERLGELDYDR